LVSIILHYKRGDYNREAPENIYLATSFWL
jgi:hypothetical protein